MRIKWDPSSSRARPPSSLEDPDPLASERERVMYALSLLAVVSLLPFSLNDFLRGRNALGFAILVVVAAFAADAWAIHRKRRPPVPYALLLAPIAVAITLSLATQGVIGAFWCYPTVLFFAFVLPRPVATLCSLTLLLVGTAMVLRYIGLGVTIRFFVSLTLTIIIVDIILSIIRRLQGRLLDQAVTDPLTGAFNRRYMEARLAEVVESGHRNGSLASLLVIDLDHFKRVNDDHGHAAGDAVLKGLVSIVRKRARKLDLLFRMGGEEFVLLLPGTVQADAVVVAEELRAALAEAPLLPGRTVTASFGVGELRQGDSVQSWIRQADAALYAAKQSGRNRVARRA